MGGSETNQNGISEICHSTVHRIPCKVEKDTKTNVNQYFTPFISEGKHDSEFTSSFRGYPLTGKKFNLPAGYAGLVVAEEQEALSDQERKTAKVVGTFDSFTNWNWDFPSHEQTENILDWLCVSNAIHDEVSSPEGN